jgi:hypothetical protein
MPGAPGFGRYRQAMRPCGSLGRDHVRDGAGGDSLRARQCAHPNCRGDDSPSGSADQYEGRACQRIRQKQKELRFELTVLEWSLHQWGTGRMAKLEGGELMTAKHVAAWRRKIEDLKRRLAE